MAAVALCVAVPLATASPPASGTPASATAKKQKQGPPDHGDGGLPDRDGRYGSAGAPSVLKVADGSPLTKASKDSPDAVARAYLKADKAEFGLTPHDIDQLRLTMSDSDEGATYLRYQQVSGGRDVYGGTALVTVDAKGRVLLAGGSFVSKADAAPKADLTAAEAVAVVAGEVAPNQDSEPGRRLGAKDGTVEFENTLSVPDYAGAPVAAELVTVGTAEGARTAWQVQADRASNASYVVLVDAVAGEVLVRQNQLSEDNQARSSRATIPKALHAARSSSRPAGPPPATSRRATTSTPTRTPRATTAPRPPTSRTTPTVTGTTPGTTRGAPASPARRPTCR